MAKKIMLWPSARTKFVKDDNMKFIFYSLIILSIVMVFLNYYMFSFMYAIKLVLMIIVAIIVTVESEILFYTIYVLLIPIGTPLWLVGLGALLATFLGKLLFGGFHHMIFHSSLVGVIFVTLGWPGLVDGVAFMTSFDNDIINLLFNNNFFNETLGFGGLFDATNYTPVLTMLQNFKGVVVFSFNGLMYSLNDVFLGLAPGIVGSGLALILILTGLVIKKAVNWVVPVIMIGSFLLTGFIIAYANGSDVLFPIYHLFSGSFLFVVVFIATDPITTPIDTRGKIIFAVIAGSLTMIIRNAGTYDEGVFFAIGFMMMLTPMLNQSFKKKPAKKTAPKKVGA